MMEFINLKTQQDAIRPELDRRMAAVLAHGKYIMGPELAEMERTLANFVGVGHCIGVASGTEALLIALMALGIGPGDEVISSPFTFVATGEVIALVGATPVFADVDPLTGNLDPAGIEGLITARTKAIMPVSLYGQCADMSEIAAIAARYALPVIEDGAQSFGARHRGKPSCGLSTFGATSFFPSKPLGCYGDGGALFTDDPALATAAREIRVHGQSKRYFHTRIGVGGRMDTLQCAVILSKWPRFAWEVEARARVGAAYTQKILARTPGAKPIAREEIGRELRGLRTLHVAPENTSVHAQYTLLVPRRAALQEMFKDAGIPTAVHYPLPLNAQPAYAALAGGPATPIAAFLADHVLSLPMGPDLTELEQDGIVEVIAQFAQA